MSADFIISQLLFLDAEDDKKDIRLFINSPGGSVTAGMLLSLSLLNKVSWFLLLFSRFIVLIVLDHFERSTTKQ